MADLAACLEGLWPAAAGRGVSRAQFDAWTFGLAPEPRVLNLLEAQPEFIQALWDYLDGYLGEERIRRGRDILVRHRSVFDAVEQTYAVDRHILAAIWGVETNFGADIGTWPVLPALATLACQGRRQSYFRDEFVAALVILASGDIAPDLLNGSWSGAFGQTQFMPTSFERFAVDFDGDGRRDIVGSVADVIASTANYLKLHGWVPGSMWGYEVEVPTEFDYRLADATRPLPIDFWRSLGIMQASGKPLHDSDRKPSLLLPAGVAGPAFLVFENFHVILSYNPAEAYALAVALLSDRLRGGDPVAHPWPRGERNLTGAERVELQGALASCGFDLGGPPDGLIGPASRRAIREFQDVIGATPDGFPSAGLLDRLRVVARGRCR